MANQQIDLTPVQKKIHDALFDGQGSCPATPWELAKASGEPMEEVMKYLELEGY